MAAEKSPGDELDAIVVQLERAGLAETHTRVDGRVAYRLTPQGTRVGRILAIAGDDAGVVLDTLLERSEAGCPARARTERDSTPTRTVCGS